MLLSTKSTGRQNLRHFFPILEPKHRQAWLKVWFDKLEQAELENYEVFEVTEENDEEIELINEDYVFRLPTACDIADAVSYGTPCSDAVSYGTPCSEDNRKISSSSDFSYGSNSSEG